MSNRGTWQITVAGQEDLLADLPDVLTPGPVAGKRNIMDTTGYGQAASFLDLNGAAVTWQFIMTRDHTSNADAFTWYMTDAMAYEGVATVTLTHQDYTGAETSWNIVGAKIEITVDEPIGMTTITHITLTGPPAVLQA